MNYKFILKRILLKLAVKRVTMNIEDVKENQLWIFYEEDFDESYMQEDIDACWSKEEKCSYFMTLSSVNLTDKTAHGYIVYRDGMAYGRTQCLEELVNSSSWTLEPNSKRKFKPVDDETPCHMPYTKTRIDELNERREMLLRKKARVEAGGRFKTDMNRNLMILKEDLSRVDNELEEIANK